MFTDDCTFKEPYPPSSNGQETGDDPAGVCLSCIVNMYRYLVEMCIIGNYPFIIIFSEQDGHAITKPMPIPTIDTSRTQVFGMSGLYVKY